MTLLSLLPLALAADLAPCAAEDPRLAESWGAVAALREALEGDSLPAIDAALDAALATPCLALAAREVPRPRFEHPAAARAWWAAGGEDWLRAELSPEAGRWLHLPPTPRAVLDDDALAPLLCPLEDAACAAPTAGWRLRAERALQAHPHAGERGEVEACDEAHPDDYVSWFGCADLATSHDRYLLPVGALQVPDAGWLVVRGARRVDGERCEQLNAYDLATGAAVSAQRCEVTELIVGPDGARSQPQGPTLRQGHVPVDNLRELTWMLLLAPEIDRVGRPDSVPLLTPEGAPRVRPDEEPLAWLSGRGFGGGYLEQEWWLTGAAVKAQGTLWWPSYPTPVETHVSELNAVVEAALAEGCLASAPPPLGEDELAQAAAGAARCAPHRSGR